MTIYNLHDADIRKTPQQQPPKKCVDADDCRWSTTQRCNPTCDYYNIGIPLRSRPHTSTPCKNYTSKCEVNDCISHDDITNCERFDCDAYCEITVEREAAIRTEERNKILRLVESDEWQKEHDEQTRNQTLDKFKEVIRLHDEDELLYPDLYNEFLVIYKSLRKEHP